MNRLKFSSNLKPKRLSFTVAGMLSPTLSRRHDRTYLKDLFRRFGAYKTSLPVGTMELFFESVATRIRSGPSRQHAWPTRSSMATPLGSLGWLSPRSQPAGNTAAEWGQTRPQSLESLIRDHCADGVVCQHDVVIN